MWQSIISFLSAVFSRNNRLENREDFRVVTEKWGEFVSHLESEVSDLRKAVIRLSERIEAEEEKTRLCEEGRRHDAALIEDLKRRIEQLERNP